MSLTEVLRLVILAFGILGAGGAVAGDYTVSYAFDGTAPEDAAAGTSPLNETGTMKECAYGAHCGIELTKSDLSISVIVTRSKRDTVSVRAYRHQAGQACCYFSDGERYVSRELGHDIIRLHLYEGHPRRGNEFVQNLHLGVLYLQFSDLR